jgi:hypothetical protein
MTRKLRALLRELESRPELQAAAEQQLAQLMDQAQHAAEEFTDFHWGDEPDAVLEAELPRIDPGDSLSVLGELVRVDYATHKGGEAATWWHAFKRRRPLLASTCTDRPRLVIVAGDYTIEPRGIVG